MKIKFDALEMIQSANHTNHDNFIAIKFALENLINTYDWHDKTIFETWMKHAKRILDNHSGWKSLIIEIDTKE